MKTPVLLFLVLLSLNAAPQAHGLNAQAQERIPPRDVFPAGAILSWGVGPVSLRDEYISRERYSGPLPSLSLQWARFHEKSGFRMEMDLANSSRVKSHRVATAITEFALDLDVVYPAGAISLGSRQAYLFLGPTSGISLLVNDQQIASHGLEAAISFVSLFSLGATGDAVVPISSRLVALGSVRVALVSAGLRMVDLMADSEESPFRLLGPWSATRAVASLGLRYQALDWCSLGVGYQTRLLRVTPWDPLASARDHLTFAVGLGHGGRRG